MCILELETKRLLYYNEEEEHWDISYNLGKLFWGNGYVTETMNMVMRYAVEKKNTEEIGTSYAIENSASGRVIQKLGFQFVKEVDYECNGGELVTTNKNGLKIKMDNISGKLQVFFEEPFGAGIFEHIENGKPSVAKVTFGTEPITRRFREDERRKQEGGTQV